MYNDVLVFCTADIHGQTLQHSSRCLHILGSIGCSYDIRTLDAPFIVLNTAVSLYHGIYRVFDVLYSCTRLFLGYSMDVQSSRPLFRGLHGLAIHRSRGFHSSVLGIYVVHLHYWVLYTAVLPFRCIYRCSMCSLVYITALALISRGLHPQPPISRSTHLRSLVSY